MMWRIVIVAVALSMLTGCVTTSPCVLLGNEPFLTSPRDTKKTRARATKLNQTGAQLGCWRAR